MLAPVLLALAAPVTLVLLALVLASVRMSAGPCTPRSRCAWSFLAGAAATRERAQVALRP